MWASDDQGACHTCTAHVSSGGASVRGVIPKSYHKRLTEVGDGEAHVVAKALDSKPSSWRFGVLSYWGVTPQSSSPIDASGLGRALVLRTPEGGRLPLKSR